jgi:hypothetical protein
MKSTLLFALTVISLALSTPAALAADSDLDFLRSLGGTAVAQGGRTLVKFSDGTIVALDGTAISTSDVVGNVFTTDASQHYMSVETAGSGLVEYFETVDLSGAVATLK